MKFTQEIKDNWLKALKSGDYIQGHTKLTCDIPDRVNTDKKIAHCCLGVLGDITEGLDTVDITDYGTSKSPYIFIKSNFGKDTLENLWKTNDRFFTWDKPDYSDVIPLIEKLEVKE